MAEIKAYNKNLWYKTGYDAAYGSIAYFKSLSPNSFILSLGPSTIDMWRTAKFYLDVVPGKQYLFSCRVTFLYVKQGSLRISFGSPAEGNFPSAYGAIKRGATLGTFSLSYSFTPTAPDLAIPLKLNRVPDVDIGDVGLELEHEDTRQGTFEDGR